MDKRFLSLAAVFIVFSGLPIGAFMLSVAIYPTWDFTLYMVDNFENIIIPAFATTVFFMGIVFYFYPVNKTSETSRRSG